MDYPDDKELYALMRETWIGLNIKTLSNLKSLLEKKCRDEEMDLDALLME